MNARPSLPPNLLLDELVRKVVVRNHYPEEEWLVVQQNDGATAVETWRVVCETCKQEWPCATRETLLAMEKEKAWG